MIQEKKEEIIRYLQNQISQADFRARAYVFDERGDKNPRRKSKTSKRSKSEASR